VFTPWFAVKTKGFSVPGNVGSADLFADSRRLAGPAPLPVKRPGASG